MLVCLTIQCFLTSVYSSQAQAHSFLVTEDYFQPRTQFAVGFGRLVDSQRNIPTIPLCSIVQLQTTQRQEEKPVCCSWLSDEPWQSSLKGKGDKGHKLCPRSASQSRSPLHINEEANSNHYWLTEEQTHSLKQWGEIQRLCCTTQILISSHPDSQIKYLSPWLTQSRLWQAEREEAGPAVWSCRWI